MKTQEEEENLEQASDTLSEDQLNRYKTSIEEAQGEMNSNYLARNRDALNWCQARWPGQYNNGRKWAELQADRELLLPWPNASDTRERTVEMLVNDHVTVGMFALQNMKVQARSTHPILTMRQSQQMTTLLNWQLFTHMKTEMHREMYLALNWRFLYGCSFIETVWEQQMRLWRETITVMTLAEFLQEGMMGGEIRGQRSEIRGQIGMGGDAPTIDEVAGMIMDEGYEEDMMALIQSMSEIVSKPEARQAVKDLRELRYAEIKVPDVFVSKPRVGALRAGVDLLFDKELDDPANARWFDRIERVSEAELLDRIETAGYDADFVDEALDFKGESTGDGFGGRAGGYTVNTIGPNTRAERARVGARGRDEGDALVELHHRYAIQHDRDVPVMFCTVLHMNVDRAGKHEPYGYDHGQYPFHVMRNEYKERAILSSEGIPEKAYTWEMELKSHHDAQTDRSDLALQPPLFTDSYEEVQKMKAAFMPTAIVPVRRHGSFQWFQPPQYDVGSVQIVQQIRQKVREFYPLFGADVDPDKKQMYRGTLANNLMTEMHPVIFQIGQLDQQFLPDDVVASVGGPNAQPIHLSRRDIQGQFQVSATIDIAMIDSDYLDTIMKYGTALAGLDTMGVGDRAYLVRGLAEKLGTDFAENFVQDTAPATEQERQDEIKAVNAILSSGIDQTVPTSGNFQLRLQTLQQHAQELLSTNKVVQRFVQQNPEVMEVLQNRAKGFAGQLQQGENAKIGRAQTTETFTKNAPVAQAQLGM